MRVLAVRRSLVAAALIVAAIAVFALPPLTRPASAAGQGSVRFNGTSSIIAVPDNAALRLTNNFTLEARVKPDATSRQVTMFGKSFYELSMFPTAGGVQFALVVRQGAWREARTQILPVGQWYTVAGTYDGAFLRVFVNGELAASSALSGAIETSTRPLYLGSVEGVGDIFPGLLDEVRVSNVVRYQNAYAVNPTPFATDGNTVGLWHFDEGSGTVANDASGRGFHGNLLDGVAWSTESPFNTVDAGAPVLSAIEAVSVTGRTATIRWISNEPATSWVEYGPTTGYGSFSALDPTKLTTHAVGISGLIPSTTYHYRVASRDVTGNETVSPDRTFVTSAGTTAAADVGQWETARNWPLVAVHQIQLHTGEVLMYDAWELPARPRLWNPQTNVFTDVPVPAGIFCSGHSVLPDGKVVVVGGHQDGSVGIRDAFLFDPATKAFTRLPDMASQRWYPTATSLADGKVLVLSGMNAPTGWSDTPELFDPATNTFRRLTGINTGDMHEEEYPVSFLLPDGKVFAIIPSTGQVRLIDAAAQTYTPAAPTEVRSGSAVMYRPGKILYMGGGDSKAQGQSRNNAQVVDMNGPAPQWRDVSAMSQVRYQHTAVTMADGQVMVIGGSAVADQTSREGTVIPEIWNPDTEAFTNAAPHRDRRMYHSTAMLLPDGRILSAGGGRLSPAIDYPTAEIYSPPYLFRGARPTITAAPATLAYGQPSTLSSPEAGTVTKAHLVRMASVTHTLDQDQHFVPLNVSTSGSTVTVTGPVNAGTAPPGYYMLFLVNGNGVPSMATTVKIGGTAPADTQAPTVGLTAPAGGATVAGTTTIAANAADNVGVTGVQFQVDGTNLGGLDTAAPYSAAWDTLTATPGTHTLRAIARDAAGNTTTSSPITVTVNNTAPDTTAPVITNPRAATITRTGALINWVTNEASTSQVEWGMTTTYGNLTPLDPARVTEHGVTVTGLSELTTYHARVRSRDAAGNESISADLVFTTNGPFQCLFHTPADGSTVSGTTQLTADTRGGTGPFSVQFMVDANSLGSPDTTPPFSMGWDTRTVANGSHVVGAVATDATGAIVNSTTSTVTVDNSRPAPVAAFGFDEGTGTSSADASGNGNTARWTTGVGWSPSGKYGGALSFDGSSHATVNDAPSLRLGSGMTVSAWVRPSVNGDYRTVALKETANSLAYGLYSAVPTAGPAAYINTGGSDIEAGVPSALPLNAWTHLAMTYDGSSFGVYVNGALQTTRAASGGIVTSTGALRIGGNAVWGERFSGLIDELRVYNVALSPAVLQADMVTPVTSGPVVDTRPPAVSGLTLASATRTSATLTWTTDEAATTQLEYGPTTAYGSTTTLDATLTTGHAVTLSGLTSGATYQVRARGRDAAGNEGLSTNVTIVLNQPLAVAISAPAGGTTVSGTVTVQATPTAGDPPYSVQFIVDGANVGALDATAPYSLNWDSRTVTDGVHQIGARATDGGGATATSPNVAVTVNNAVPAGPRPVAAWNFNEASGTSVTDATGNGQTGTFGTGVTRTTTAKFGGALQFSGSSPGYVTVPDSPLLDLTTGMTVEAWVRPTSVSGYRTVLLKERPGGLAYTLYASGGSPSRPAAYLNTGGSDVRSAAPAALTTNTWVHLAVTYDGTAIRVFVNGTLVTTTPQTGAVVTSTGALRIGGNAVWGERFAGQIDEVRIYNTAVVAAQIQQDMNTPI